MRTLTLRDAKLSDSRMIARKAWILTSKNEIGQEQIDQVSLRAIIGMEKVTLRYPNWVRGTRQGEARYVHLASMPDRLSWRALTGILQ